MSLTGAISWGVPEGLIEFGQVENHQQLVWFSLCSHLLSPDHRLNAKLSLSHVKCQLVISCHIFLVKRVVVTEKGQEWGLLSCVCSVTFFISMMFYKVTHKLAMLLL